MITKTETSVPSVLETKRQAEPLSTRLWLALAAALAVLSLGVFIANQPAAVATPRVAVSDAAANPELMVAQRYAAALEAGAQRGIEAESARHNGLAAFYAAQAGETDSTFLAANPELMVAGRYEALAK